MIFIIITKLCLSLPLKPSSQFPVITAFQTLLSNLTDCLFFFFFLFTIKITKVKNPPHFSQKLMKSFLTLQWPETELAGYRHWVADAVKQGPMTIQGQIQLFFKWYPQTIDGEDVLFTATSGKKKKGDITSRSCKIFKNQNIPPLKASRITDRSFIHCQQIPYTSSTSTVQKVRTQVYKKFLFQTKSMLP